jgi:hypothetical protein
MAGDHQMTKPVLISFSGGKTSGLMSAILNDYFADREKVFVFANTGKEREETLHFVNECDKRWGLSVVWVEADIQPYGVGTKHKIVTYGTASRNGEPFEAMLEKFGIPNMAFPHCSRELKLRPIHSLVRSMGWTDYETAIGIRADEQHRIGNTPGFIYPLVEYGIDKRIVNEWWGRQPFTLNLQEHEGNCDFCWKKSEKKLVRQINERPDAFSWWEEMEATYSTRTHGQRSSKIDPTYFYRQNISAPELRRIAFEAAKQRTLFDGLSETEYDCLCKST